MVQSILRWFEYARDMALPTVIWCGLIIGANLVVMRAPAMSTMSRQVVREQMQQLGSMSRPELMTAIIIASDHHD